MTRFSFTPARIGAAALALTTLAVACSDDATGTGGTGTVVVRLTDAPIDSVREVNVYVTRIDAKAADSDSAAVADTASRGGWVTLASPARVYNLLALRTDTARFAPTSLQAGTWRSLRLVIDPTRSHIILKDGTRLDGSTAAGGNQPGISFPSAAQSGIKVRLDKALTVADGDTTTVVVDFDASQSFHQRGNAMKNGLMFRPVIRATVSKD